MNRVKTIKYICDTPIDEIVKRVQADNLDIKNVISSCLESRKEYGLKVQELVERLNSI